VSAVTAVGLRQSVRLSVCPTVILVYCMEMAKDVTKLFLEQVVPSF